MTPTPFNDTIYVVVECKLCYILFTLRVDARGYALWESGTHIQSALPDLPADQREFLISGVCPACFNGLFPPEDEDA